METMNFEKETIKTGYLFFEKYVTPFILTEDKLVAESLQLKKDHSERVSGLCRLIAKKLLLGKEEQEMAGLIGLWHDIGRFDQFKKYRTFNDQESVDHAELGVLMIKDQGFMVEISEGNKRLIIEAIRHHNQLGLPAKMDNQLLLFSQILRDADKLDIWGICVSKLQKDGSFSIPSMNYGLPKNGQINAIVLESINRHQPVSKNDVKSVDDFKLFLISMVFDLNFKSSFQWLNEKQFIQKIYESMPKKDEVYDAYRKVRLYIENKFVV